MGVLKDYFESMCYNTLFWHGALNENNTLFWYNEDLMLFKIVVDPIEACDVADEYPEIVDELLQTLDDNIKGNYYGNYLGYPTAASALVSFTSWDCEENRMYLKSWE